MVGLFNVKYWPYVNANENVKECVEKNFADSLTNLRKASGALQSVAFSMLSLTAVSLFLHA